MLSTVRLRPRALIVAVLALALSASAGSQPLSDDAALPDTVVELLRAGRYAEARPALDRFASRRNGLAAYYLGQMYSCGRGVAFSCGLAERYLRQSLLSATAKPRSRWWSDDAKNEIAWIHSACEDPGFIRNAQVALGMARDVTSRSSDPHHVDTLAAALANAGDFVMAATTQRAALDSLRTLTERDSSHASTVLVFRERLALYEQRRPARFGIKEATIACQHMP